MNYEKLNKKMSEFFENVTGEELVAQLEELGYKLIEKEQQVNSVDLANVVLSEELTELVCGECKEVKKLEYCVDCYNEACGAL